MANMFTDIGLHGYPLLKFPSYNSHKRDQTSPEPYADPSRLLACANGLREWYDYIASLPVSEFANFACTDWARFVMSVILGLRLSFPIPNECPGWDHAAARRILDLGTFLQWFSGDNSDSETLTPASSKASSHTDVLSASRVVVGVVRRKYDKRLSTLEIAAAMEPSHPFTSGIDKGLHKCPMLDGSLDQYFHMWDGSFSDPTSFVNPPLTTSTFDTGSVTVDQTGSVSDLQPMIFHDLWATMTMGWSQEGFGDVDYSDII